MYNPAGGAKDHLLRVVLDAFAATSRGQVWLETIGLKNSLLVIFINSTAAQTAKQVIIVNF